MATSTVVAGISYDTLGNGGRKLVRLSNGWFVVAVWDSFNYQINLYVSKDNGQTWSRLCYIKDATNTYRGSITSHSNKVTVLFANAATVRSVTIDATSQIDTNIFSLNKLVDTQSGIWTDQVSIVSNNTGTELHTVWASKNTTYPNCFNIRYSKSTDGGVTWSTPTQLTTRNTTGDYYQNPSIAIKGDGNPIIVCETSLNKSIHCLRYNGSAWSGVDVYAGNTYAQSNPSAVVDGNGVIHVVWHGRNASQTTNFRITYSKSTDGGATWSAIEYPSEASYYQESPVISVDKNNNLYVFYLGLSSLDSSYYDIYYVKKTASWGSLNKLTSTTTNHAIHPSVIEKETGSMIGWVWVDLQSSSVKFDSMTFNVPPTLTLTSPTNNQVLSEGQSILKNDKTDFLFKILPNDSDSSDTIQYSVLLRNVTRTTYTSCSKGVEFTYILPFSELLLGNNLVTVKIKDNNGAETIRNFTVRRTMPDTLSQKSVYDTMVYFA